jgi:hypothetical protein
LNRISNFFLSAPLILLMLVPGTAHAYLDPGTGSFILQMVIAGMFSALFYIEMTWANISARFNNLFSKNESKLDEDEAIASDESNTAYSPR